MKRLNLGAGCDYREGWINHQHPDTKGDKAERRCDLNVFPWACFKDAEFDEVEASHILEHLNDIVPVMKELARIIKPGGKLIINVPHFSRTWVHPMHKTVFPIHWYGSITGEGWLPADFEMESATLCWSLNRIYRSKAGLVLGKVGNAIINPLANGFPMFCERVWCYWVGGFDEIKLVFIRR